MIDTSLDSSNFYFLLAVFQGLILSSIIIFYRPRNKPNFFLGVLILLISLALLQVVLESSISAYNAKYPIPLSFRFAYGPLAYLHIIHIKDPLRSFRIKDLIHFVPSLLSDIIFFTSSFLYIGANLDWAYANVEMIRTIALFVALICNVQLAIYTYLIYKESVDTKQVLKEFKGVKSWLSMLIISWFLVIGFHMIMVPINLVYLEQYEENAMWVIYIPLGIIQTIWIFGLGYSYVLKYVNVMFGYMDKIKKFSFTSSELADRKKTLIQSLEQEYLYKDSKLTLAKLAGHLGWPINTVSKMINDTLHTNFNDLINSYRVAAFKELSLEAESKKYSILGLGQEVGFSSKASFYRAFKKETGMTPSEFMINQV